MTSEEYGRERAIVTCGCSQTQGHAEDCSLAAVKAEEGT